MGKITSADQRKLSNFVRGFMALTLFNGSLNESLKVLEVC
jgi:hypothetical protein